MKQLKESWLYYTPQLRSVVESRNPHAILLAGVATFVVWWICNLFLSFENPSIYRFLLAMIAGFPLYFLLCRGGDPFLLSLYKSSFMRDVLLCGRRVEMLIYSSTPLSIFFSLFLMSLVVLHQIEYADLSILQGFRIPALPYIVVRSAIAIEGEKKNSVYMEEIEHFRQTYSLITSPSVKSAQVLIGYCVSIPLLVLTDLGHTEKGRITALKDTFLETLAANEIEANLSDKIAAISRHAGEACSCATNQSSFTLGCKAVASKVGLCPSPLSSLADQLRLLCENSRLS